MGPEVVSVATTKDLFLSAYPNFLVSPHAVYEGCKVECIAVIKAHRFIGRVFFPEQR